MNRRISLLIAAILVAAIAFGLRARAVSLLPIDYDEDDYLRAGQQYADAIRRGDWAALTQLNYRPEHPPLSKLIYGAALLPLPQAAEIPDRPTTAEPASSLPQPHLWTARMAAALAGSLEVLLLALFNPLAGLFLAIHTWEIKYTSQVMLEAIPSFTSLLMVFAYLKSKQKWNGWLAISAIAFGLTEAAKYPYGLVGLVVIGHWLWTSFPGEEDRSLTRLLRWLVRPLAWSLAAAAIFFLIDPYLWPDPLHRLAASLLYHGGYADSEAVKAAGFPAWQPLVWLFESVPFHPGLFLISLDLGIAVLAVLGFPRLWRERRIFAVWLLVVLAYLLVWPTKWPQYILMLTVPVSFAASEGFRGSVWEPILGWIRRVRRPRQQQAAFQPAATWRETRRAFPWLVPGTLILGVITLFPLAYQLAMSATDFNVLSIRDGLQGGVWREVWLGLSGKVQPVNISLGPDGRLQTTDRIEDRGEVRHIPATKTQGVFSNKDVHFTGPAVFFGLLSEVGATILVFEIFWTLITVGLQTALGLVVAMALNRRGIRFAGWWRTLYILPWAIPEFVGAMVWLNVFEPTNGWLSLALGKPINWYQSLNQSLAVLVISALWMGWPFMMLAATAGLKLLPVEIYDAAAIDGASGWKQFRWITWPLLLPLLGPAIIIRSIYAFNQFYLFYVMNPPFPLYTFSTLSFFFFDTNRGGGLFSLSAGLNLITVLFLFGLISWLNRWNKAAEEVGYA